MRYLGDVASKTGIYHIKQLCIIEMLARTLKGTLNTSISRKILSHRSKIESLNFEL
jgi:hypothetical protein